MVQNHLYNFLNKYLKTILCSYNIHTRPSQNGYYSKSKIVYIMVLIDCTVEPAMTVAPVAEQKWPDMTGVQHSLMKLSDDSETLEGISIFIACE